MRWGIGLLSLLLVLGGIAHAALLFQAGTPADYVRTAGVGGDPTAYPISLAWVGKLTGNSADRQLFQMGFDGAVGAGFIWTCASTNVINAYLHGASSINSTGAVPAAVWVFIGASHASATSHRFFIYNYESRQVIANETSTADLGAALIASISYNTIGAYDNGTPQAGGMAGTVSWVAVYARDFTGANGDYFRNLAHLGPYIHGAPALLYSFLDMTGTTTLNRTSVSNTGTLTNFQASPWTYQGLPRLMPW